MVGGTAEAMVNPFSVLKNAMGDVSETLGSFLIPLIKDAVNKIVDIAIKVQEWTKAHPELAKTLTLVTLAIGIITTVIGGLILIIPKAILAFKAFGLALKTGSGPIGWIILAIQKRRLMHGKRKKRRV